VPRPLGGSRVCWSLPQRRVRLLPRAGPERKVTVVVAQQGCRLWGQPRRWSIASPGVLRGSRRRSPLPRAGRLRGMRSLVRLTPRSQIPDVKAGPPLSWFRTAIFLLPAERVLRPASRNSADPAPSWLARLGFRPPGKQVRGGADRQWCAVGARHVVVVECRQVLGATAKSRAGSASILRRSFETPRSVMGPKMRRANEHGRSPFRAD